MITSCNHSENIICGSCLMKNHQEKQVTENLLRGEHGGIICWCYSIRSAEMIANALNNSWQDAYGVCILKHND